VSIDAGAQDAARFGRVSWKYSSIAYALILKDVRIDADALPDGD
jgi:hypothetical protein